VITKKSVNSVMNERTLLSSLKHPFLVNMFYAFQDRDNLFLVMDIMPGGDLRYHIGRQRRFTEEQTSKIHKLKWILLLFLIFVVFLSSPSLLRILRSLYLHGIGVSSQ